MPPAIMENEVSFKADKKLWYIKLKTQNWLHLQSPPLRPPPPFDVLYYKL